METIETYAKPDFKNASTKITLSKGPLTTQQFKEGKLQVAGEYLHVILRLDTETE